MENPIRQSSRNSTASTANAPAILAVNSVKCYITSKSCVLCTVTILCRLLPSPHLSIFLCLDKLIVLVVSYIYKLNETFVNLRLLIT